jgi:hypothetical protein
MMFHLHRYAREISVERVDTGEVLYRANVEWNAADQLKPTPIYLSRDGVRLEAETNYRLSAVYDNVSDAPVVAMVTAHIYFHREPAQARP